MPEEFDIQKAYDKAREEVQAEVKKESENEARVKRFQSALQKFAVHAAESLKEDLQKDPDMPIERMANAFETFFMVGSLIMMGA